MALLIIAYFIYSAHSKLLILAIVILLCTNYKKIKFWNPDPVWLRVWPFSPPWLNSTLFVYYQNKSDKNRCYWSISISRAQCLNSTVESLHHTSCPTESESKQFYTNWNGFVLKLFNPLSTRVYKFVCDLKFRYYNIVFTRPFLTENCLVVAAGSQNSRPWSTKF